MEPFVKLYIYYIYVCFIELKNNFIILSDYKFILIFAFMTWLVVVMICVMLSSWSGCYSVIIIFLGGKWVLICSNPLYDVVSRNGYPPIKNRQ